MYLKVLVQNVKSPIEDFAIDIPKEIVSWSLYIKMHVQINI